MQNAALTAMALSDPRFAIWKYFRFEVHPDDLPEALGLFHARGFLGLNLTVPHKVLAFGRVARIDEAARSIGAVNTLLAIEQGWHGFNTDGYGLATGIRTDLGLPLKGADVILLGAGGAARGAAVECFRQGVSSLWIGNRTRTNLEALLSDLRPIAAGIPLHGFDPTLPPRDCPRSALLINATSAGLRSSDEPPLDLAAIPSPTAVYDMIYNPPETRLLAAARGRSIRAANGLSMLVHQGARALEIWSQAVVPVAAMQSAAHAALRP
jgi:shikimate dehydrogenase